MRFLTRSAITGAGVAACLAITGSGVLADTPRTHIGVYGTHYLQDSAEFAGMSCDYDGNQVIDHLRVRGPVVYARNTTAGADAQSVGWRFSLQRAVGDSNTWTTFYQSPVRRAMAGDATPMVFGAMSYSFAGSANARYRAIVGMRWYAADQTTIQGNVTHLVDYYSGAAFQPSFGPAGYCPGGVF